MTEFRAVGARIVGISVDAPATSAKLHKRLGLRFDLLSDPDMTAIRDYGVQMKDMDLAIPAVFVVNRAGTIVYRNISETMTDRPYVGDVLSAVRAADQ